MYKVYKVECGRYYNGIALVSADSVEEANSYITAFKKADKDNENDSWGYDYVGEYDVMDNLFSDVKGIIYYGIYYKG